MNIEILSASVRAFEGANILVTVKFADIAALAGGTSAAGVLNLYPGVGNMVAGSKVKCIGARVRTPLVSSNVTGTPTSVTVSLGDGSSAVILMAAAEILGVHASDVMFGKPIGAEKTYEVADTIDATFTMTGTSAIFSEITAGQVEFYLAVDQPADLPAGS